MVIATAALAALLALLSFAFAAPTGSCGAELAAQDLAGTCRSTTPTPGALEAVGPALPKPTGGGITVKPTGGGVTVQP